LRPDAVEPSPGLTVGTHVPEAMGAIGLAAHGRSIATWQIDPMTPGCPRAMSQAAYFVSWTVNQRGKSLEELNSSLSRFAHALMGNSSGSTARRAESSERMTSEPLAARRPSSMSTAWRDMRNATPARMSGRLQRSAALRHGSGSNRFANRSEDLCAFRPSEGQPRTPMGLRPVAALGDRQLDVLD
jgi:hypothetical protein